MLTMDQAKKLGVKGAGQTFEGKNGVVGTILDFTTPEGKAMAEFTCEVEGCEETHQRMSSDWHQSSKCRTHAKSKAKKEGSTRTSGGGSRFVKLDDGTILREQKIGENDSAEDRAAKEEFNRTFEVLHAQQAEAREAEKSAAKAEREAKMAAEKAERDAKKSEEKRKALAEQLARAQAEAAKRGVNVSPKLVAEVAAS